MYFLMSLKNRGRILIIWPTNIKTNILAHVNISLDNDNHLEKSFYLEILKILEILERPKR